jgi:prolyl oligopeptidase
LPIRGTVDSVVADFRRAGITLTMKGWSTPRVIYRYSNDTGKFVDTGLQPRSSVDMSAIASKEVSAESLDGTMVPLSILYRRDLKIDGSRNQISSSAARDWGQ